MAAQGIDPAYLMGVLNAPVADFVFRSTAKPFRGDDPSANKQFIAPLPIPNVSPKDRAEVAVRARGLQRNWTRRRELMQSTEARLSVLARARHPARWLWPDLHDLPEMIAQAPPALKLQVDRRAWAEAQLNELEASRLEALQAALDGGGRLEAAFRDDELLLYAGGTIILGSIYLDDGVRLDARKHIGGGCSSAVSGARPTASPLNCGDHRSAPICRLSDSLLTRRRVGG